jgi:hypothetical protein
VWRVSSILEMSGVSTFAKALDPKYQVRGTAIHKANEALAEGYTPTDAPPEYLPFIEGLAGWYRRFEPTVIATERRIIDRLNRTTGQLDLVALLARPAGLWLYVIDVKTGARAPWHGIQTAGYKDLAAQDDALWAMMGEPWASIPPSQRYGQIHRGVIYLPGDGTACWVEQVDPTDDYLFRSARALMQWRHDNGLLHYVDAENPTNDPVTVLEGEAF